MHRFALSLALALCALAAPAWAQEPAPPAPLTEPNRGSLGAEIGGALLGDLLGTALTTGVVLSTLNYCDEDCEDSPRDPVGLWMATYAARPVLVGGFTGLLARPSGGQGRTWIAMAGALPGSALMALGLASGEPSVLFPCLLAGHIAAVGGAVWGYRSSADRPVEPPPKRTVVPGFFSDRRSGSMGLSLSGTF